MNKTPEQIAESKRKHKASNMPKRAKQQEIFTALKVRLAMKARQIKEEYKKSKQTKTEETV